MTISATTQGLRPGVCTSSNRPASPFEGQMIYETDTDLTYVYGGSAWQQVSGGTAVGNSGLVYITSVDFAGNTAINIDGCFTSTYDTYQVIVSNYNSATTGYLWVQTRSGSPASTDTGANYVFNESFGAANTGQTYWRLAYTYNSTDRTNATINIYQPFNSATGTSCNSIYSARNSTSTFFTNLTAGQKQTQSSDTGLRFTSSAGAVALNGLVTILGVRKA